MYRIEVDLRGPDGVNSPNNVHADRVPGHRVGQEVQKCLDGFDRYPDVQLLEIRIIP